MLRLKAILTCIILIYSIVVNCQEDQAFSLANHYSTIGNKEAALKEYLHAYFLNSEDTQNKNVALSIARLYAEGGNTSQAIKYYDIHFFQSRNDLTIQNAIRYEKIQLYLAAKSYKLAKIEALQINKRAEDNLNKYYFYKGLVHYFNKEYVIGLSTLSKIEYLSLDHKKQLNSLCKKLIKNDKQGTKLNQIASGIIPGMGQYLAGDIKGGVNSTVLNGGLIYLFISVGERLSYGDAALSVTPWLMRYFIGGVGNAKKAAIDKKLKQQNKYMAATIELISTAKGIQFKESTN